MKQLTKEEIKRIEKAFLLFRRRRISQSYKDEFKKLNKLLAEDKNIFEIANQMAVIFNAGRYIEFIATIYKELHIFGDNFNWEEFNRNMINFMVFNSLSTQYCLIVTDARKLYNNNIDKKVTRSIDNYCSDIAAVILEKAKKIINNHNESRLVRALEETIRGIFDKYDGGSLHGFDMITDRNSDIPKLSIRHGDNKYITGVVENLDPAPSAINYIKINANAMFGDEGDVANTSDNCKSLKKYLYRSFIWREKILNGYGDTTIVSHNGGAPGGHDYNDADYNDANPDTPIAHALHEIPQEGLQFLFKMHDFKINPNRMSVCIKKSNEVDSDTKNNNLLIDSIFDSLMLNIMTIIDKYWMLKYNGTIPLPMNVQMMIKGGSVFDSEEFHDITTAEIIPEAVPFYITGLNVCSYYIKNLGNKAIAATNDASRIGRRLKISKLSVLYPIAEIFDKYGATVQTISMNQLTTAIGVFNDIWNQTSGSNELKLSASIDMLLNELNASMFLGDELNNSVVENGYGSVGQFLRSSIGDIERILRTIEDVFKNAAIQSYNMASPEEEQIAFEKLMRDSYQKIKALPAEQRMTELRSLLTKKEDDDIGMHEYYKFMDLVIAPLITCAESYNNVFKLFEVFGVQNNEGLAKTMDLRKYTIQKAKPNPDWIKTWKDADHVVADDVTKVDILKLPDNNNADANHSRFISDGTVNFWNFINSRNVSDEDVRFYLEDSPVVQRWNVFQFNKMLEKYARNRRLEAPNFWYVWNRNTWPIEPIISFNIKVHQGHTKAIESLRSVFSGFNAKTVADYLEFAIKEFANDLDQVIHLFMSYPGLSDRTIRALESYIHDQITADNILKKDNIKNMIALMKTIKVEKSKSYIYPTDIPGDLPVFTDNVTVIDSLKFINKSPIERIGGSSRVNSYIAQDNYKNMLNGYVQTRASETNEMGVVPSTNVYRDSMTDKNKGIVTVMGKSGSLFRNGWSDWAIGMLAKAHPQRVIPYKLAQMIIGDTVLGQVCKPMMNVPGRAWSYAVNVIGHKDIDVFFNNGAAPNTRVDHRKETVDVYISPFTQNILARSITDSNKAVVDYAAFGQNSVNSLVSMLPFVISQLQSAYESMESTAVYYGIRGIEECGSLISILSKFYNEISTAITPISFLQKTISSYDVDHPLGELTKILDWSASGMQDFTQVEWANKYKFVNLHSITYPDFKNKDKFEWIHKFASNVFTHPIFSSNFKVILENMGKQTWNSLIANSFGSGRMFISVIGNETLKVIRSLLQQYITTGSTSRDELQYFFDMLFNNKSNAGIQVSSDSAIGNDGWNWGAGEGEVRMTGGISGGVITGVSEEFRKAVDNAAFKLQELDAESIANLSLGGIGNKVTINQGLAAVAQAIESGASLYRALPDIKIPINKTLEVNIQTRNVLDDAVSTYIENKTTLETDTAVNISEWNTNYVAPTDLDIINVIENGFLRNHFRKNFCNHLNTIFQALTNSAGATGKDFSNNEIGSLAIRAFACAYAIGANKNPVNIKDINNDGTNFDFGGGQRGSKFLATSNNNCPREMLVLWDTLSGMNNKGSSIFVDNGVNEDTFINFFRALDIANDMIQMTNDEINFGSVDLTNKFKENVQKLTNAGRKIAEWCYGKKQNPGNVVIGDLEKVEYDPNYREFIKRSTIPMQINERNIEIDTLIKSLTWTRDLSNWKTNAEQLMGKYRIAAQTVTDLSNTNEGSNSYLEPAKVTKNNKLLSVNQYLVGKGSKTQENSVIVSEDVQGWLNAANYKDETADRQIIFTPIASYKMYKALTDYINVVKQIEAELIDSPPFTGATDFITELQTKVDALDDKVKNGKVIHDASAIARKRAEIEGYGTNFARNEQLNLFPDLTIHPNWKRQFYPGALWSQYDYAANTIGNKANDDTSRLLISALNLKNEMEHIVKNNHYAIDEFIFDGLMKHNKLLANIADIIVTRTQPLAGAPADGQPDADKMINVVPRTFDKSKQSKKMIEINAKIAKSENNPEIEKMGLIPAAMIPANVNLVITKNMLGNDTIPDFFSLAKSFTNTNVTSNDDANATADLKTGDNTVFRTAKSRRRDVLTVDDIINSSSVFINGVAQTAAVNAQNGGNESPYGMNVIIQPVALDNGFQFLKINPWFVNGNNLNNNVQAIRSTDAYGKQLLGYGVAGGNALNAGIGSLKANVLNFIRTFKAISISDKVYNLISKISDQTKIINKKYKNDRLTGGLSSFTQLLNMNIPNMPNTIATALSVLGSENPFGAYRAYLSMSRNLSVQTRIKNLNAIGRGVCQSFLTFMYTYVYGKLGKNVTMDLTDSFVGYTAADNKTVAANRRERVFVSIANTDLRTYMQTFKDFDLARMNCGFMIATADYPEGLMRIPGVLDKTNGIRYYEAGSINSNVDAPVRKADVAANVTYKLKQGEWLPAAPAHTERRWEYITAWLLHKNENKLQNTRDSEFAKWFKAYQATFYVLLRERMQLAYEEYKIVRDYVRNVTGGAAAQVNIPSVSGNQQTPANVPQLEPKGTTAGNDGYENVIGCNPDNVNPATLDIIDSYLHPSDPNTDQKQDLVVVNDNRIAVMCYVSYLARFNKFNITKPNQLFGGIVDKLTTIQGQRSKSYVIYPAVDILVNTFKSNIENPKIRVVVGLDRYNLFSHAMEAAVDNSNIAKVNSEIIIETDNSVTIAYPILRYLAVADNIVADTAGFANTGALRANRDVDHNGYNYAILDAVEYNPADDATMQSRTGSLNKGNIYYFDIREFFEYVLQKNLDTFINVNISEADNYGFLIPHALTGGLTGGKSNKANSSKKNKSKRKHLMQLYGGADINSVLDVHYDANSLMNNNAYGATPLKTMRHMYANRGIPYKIYAHLFNGGVYIRPDDENQIFKSAMNYFHKYNISMKSIFNSLCYAQLLTNRVQFNAIVNKLSKAVAALPAREDRNETNYSLARAYIVNVIDGDKPIWNRNDVKYDVSDNLNSSRPNHFNVGEYVKRIQGISGMEKQKYFNNIWHAPAINNNFVTAFLAHATDSSLHEDKVPYSMKLVSSLAFEKFMRLDHECTYINMLILLLRLTSYYDTNNDTEVGFFVPDDTDMFDAL